MSAALASPAGTLSKETLVVYMPPAADAAWMARMEAAYPGLRVRWLPSRAADGSLIAAEDYPAEVWAEATLLLSDWIPPAAALVPRVRYLQLTSVGHDHLRGHAAYEDPAVVFCNASGVHSPQIAEWVVATWLASQHHLFALHDNMATGHWDTSRRPVEDSPGLRVGILGYGAIGRQVARLCAALGMEVYAYTRRARETAASRRDDAFCVVPAVRGDPEGRIPARWFAGAARADVDRFLAQDLDLLVVSLPLTPDTRHLLGAPQFALLARRRTFVANVARGGHVDQTALLAALRGGQIRGAALDVADPEPLPPDHPLWRAPNLFLSPHVSWLSTHYWARNLRILETNLGRLAGGEPCVNVVERELAT